ncbi:TetR/AcrR family transcriptional regulator [Nonomuraea antimicrobica]
MSSLVTAARALFVSDGFSAVTLDAICRRAGVTRGAFYHHFRNKEHIFREVYAANQEELSAIVRRAFRAEQDPWDGITAGCQALLEASLEPAVRQITLVEAPAALGWTAMRDIQAGCKEQLRRGLTIAVEAGCIPERPWIHSPRCCTGNLRDRPGHRPHDRPTRRAEGHADPTRPAAHRHRRPRRTRLRTQEPGHVPA